MPRIPDSQLQERLADTEQALIRLRSEWRVIQAMTKKHGVNNRCVREWIQKVKAKWGTETHLLERKTERGFMRNTLNELLSAAITRTIVIKDDDGKVVLDPNTQLPLVKANPDLQRALHAASQLRALDGLDEAMKVKVEGQIITDKPIPNMAHLPPELQVKLREVLTAVVTASDAEPLPVVALGPTDATPMEPASVDEDEGPDVDEEATGPH